jgi:hypothetical protein
MKTWRCFHCDEVFRTQVDARNHFGSTEASDPACKIKAAGEFALLEALRNAEDELARYRNEDSDVLRVLWSTRADHAAALGREEEKGYARGVRDARAEKEKPVVTEGCSHCQGTGRLGTPSSSCPFCSGEGVRRRDALNR